MRPIHQFIMTQNITIRLLILALFSNILFIQAQALHAQCQSTDTFFCRIPNYKTVLPFRNTLGHTSIDQARNELHRFGGVAAHPECFEKLQLFLCSLYFPVCVSTNESELFPAPTQLLLPCRDICEEAYECEPHLRNASLSWPHEWHCEQFEYHRDNQLCVINNGDHKPVRQPTDLTHEPYVNEGCASDLFDCRIGDPKRLLCIQNKYVCDGRKDCIRNDDESDPNAGLDEANCPNNDKLAVSKVTESDIKSCLEGQLHCDNRCISWHDICNGIVDCSSGVDELDCLENSTGIIYAIIGVFILSAFIMIRRMTIYAKRYIAKFQIEESAQDIQPGASLPTSQVDVRVLISPLIPELKSQSPMPSCFDSTYQAASILARSDAYDTARIGGDSGACSVYGYSGFPRKFTVDTNNVGQIDIGNYSSSSIYDPMGNLRRASTPPPAPPPPPPTPLNSTLDHIYENG